MAVHFCPICKDPTSDGICIGCQIDLEKKKKQLGYAPPMTVRPEANQRFSGKPN